MENSNAYKYLMNQINATGSEKLDGYDSKVMEKIFDWERDEVETIIWKTFHQKKDID